MYQELIRNEYERSIDRVRGRRDRAHQIARISGIMFAIFGTVTIFILSRGGEIHAIPRFTFIASFTILTVFGIILPVFFAYILRKWPWTLSMFSLRMALRGVIRDDLLCGLMIYCTRKNRRTVGMFEWWMKWVMIPGMLVGILAVLVAVVGLCL